MSQSAASSAQTTSSQPPAVINDIKQRSGGGVSTIITADFVQQSVDATNQSIDNENNLDWSKTGLTQQQIQIAQAYNSKQCSAAEQGIRAMAAYMGVTGVDMTFTQLKGQATSGDGISPEADDTQAVISQQSDSNPAVSTGFLSDPTTPAIAPSAGEGTIDLTESVLAQSQTFPGGASVTAAPANLANSLLTSADAALALLTAAQQQPKPSGGTSADSSKTADLYV